MDTENTTPKKPRKPGSGGARANSGRKKINNKRLTKTYRFSPATLEVIKKNKITGKYVEQAIQEKLERDFLRDISQ